MHLQNKQVTSYRLRMRDIYVSHKIPTITIEVSAVEAWIACLRERNDSAYFGFCVYIFLAMQQSQPSWGKDNISILRT